MYSSGDSLAEFTDSTAALALQSSPPGARKQTSAGQGLISIIIYVITETGESWEGRCAVVLQSEVIYGQRL